MASRRCKQRGKRTLTSAPSCVLLVSLLRCPKGWLEYDVTCMPSVWLLQRLSTTIDTRELLSVWPDWRTMATRVAPHCRLDESTGHVTTMRDGVMACALVRLLRCSGAPSAHTAKSLNGSFVCTAFTTCSVENVDDVRVGCERFSRFFLLPIENIFRPERFLAGVARYELPVTSSQ
jgi:hypothetical protein